MNDDNDNELWLSHLSCASWSLPDQWDRYFTGAQEILGAPITHLDDDDPIRRRFDMYSLAENTEFVTRIEKDEVGRTLFGEMRTIDVRFCVRLHPNDPSWFNSLNWHAPADVLADSSRLAGFRRLFDLGNVLLDAFYGYGETCERQSRKKRREPGYGIEVELTGAFWLTYFNDKYVEFFGREKVADLTSLGIDVRFDQGVTLCLGQTPTSVPEGLREVIEDSLGRHSFVRHRDFTVKRPGQYALTMDQLRGK